MRRKDETPSDWPRLKTTMLGLLAFVSSAVGCTMPPPIAPTVPAAALTDSSQKHAAIQGNSRRSTANPLPVSNEEAYVVRIVAPSTSCSGSLISERLVLTAHHCVALRNGAGRVLPADLAPERLTVEFGTGHFPWAEVSVRAIVAPSCGYDAGPGDLAILVLDRKMPGVPVIKPALDHEPVLGDEVTHVGFGRCALSEDGIYLKHRSGGPVDLVTKIGFRVRAPICPGDSGGPAIDRNTGLLTGVVSAGAMDGDEATPDRVEYARIDAFRNLFANAERIAKGAAPSELPPVDCPNTTTNLAVHAATRR